MFCVNKVIRGWWLKMDEMNIRMTAQQRVEQLCDKDTFKTLNKINMIYDPIGFPGYNEKLQKAKLTSNLNEAALTGICKIKGTKCILIILDSHFIMGTMGTIVGEEITRAFEYAQKKKLPVISVVSSGGARMQEGLFSLYQMAKTVGAVMKHSMRRLLYISVITNPTMGGVSASFASLGDIILIEEGTIYGFTGKRVIEDIIKQSIPEGFQTEITAMKNGAVDKIVKRNEVRDIIGTILTLHN